MLEWITTIPGILISCGVLLLIIAIILFVLGNRKGKTVVSEVTNDATTTETVSTEEVNTVVEEAPVEPAPVVENTEPVVKEETPAENVINFTPEVETPAVAEPVETVAEPQVAEAPVEAKAPSFDFSVNEESTVTEEKPVTIYGGNDPLENTQAVNVVEEHVPYGGTPEVNVMETPTVEEVQPVVTELPTIEIPEVKLDTIDTSAKAEEITPVVEPVAETVAEPQPVVEPTLNIPSEPAQPEVVMPTIDQNM